MAKPILVVGLPVNHIQNSLEIDMYCSNVLSHIKMEDYYTIVYPSRTIEEPKFQVFYEKDMIDIEFDQLQKIVTNKMKEYAEDNKNNEAGSL